MTWIKKQLKSIWTWLTILLIGAAFAYFGDKPIPTELQLKTTSDKIINSVEMDEKLCDANGLHCTLKGRQVQYRYISTEEVSGNYYWVGDESNTEIVSTNGIETTYKIYSQNKFKKVAGKVFKIKIATTTADSFLEQTGGLISVAQADYPSNAGDGGLRYDSAIGGGLAARWADARGAATANDDQSTAAAGWIMVYDDGTDTYIGRNFYPFDTGAIPDTDTITAASLYFYATLVSNTDNDGNDYLVVTSDSQASNTSLSTADYDQLGSTAWSATQDITGLSTGYLQMALNATGLANVSATGYTKLGVRIGQDMVNDTITATKSNSVQSQFFEDTSGTKDPYMTVTSSAAAAGVTPLIQQDVWEE